MVYVQYMILFLLLATIVSADYYIDNANMSVIYAMTPSQSGQAWQTFSVSTQSLALSISNSTGNYTIPLDASHCYDENYALGVCGTSDSCFVQMPFTGSGITMYVFNAGMSGMTASFAIDGGTAVSNSINAPPGPTYQVSNVSLYTIQGLTSGNHTMVMTILDWDGSPTSMKFDYAYVNETFVAAPATISSTSMTSTTASQTTTSQTPTQTSVGSMSTSNKTNIGAIIGGTLGGVIMLGGIVMGFFFFRKRKAQHRVHPFDSERPSSSPSVPLAQHQPFFIGYHDPNPDTPVPPLTRAAILRDALAARVYHTSESSQSIRSGTSVAVSQSLDGYQPPSSVDMDPRMLSPCLEDVAGSPFSDSQVALRHSLTQKQIEIIDRLRADNVPMEMISQVIEGFVVSRLSAAESVRHQGSVPSGESPPSYQTRAR